MSSAAGHGTVRRLNFSIYLDKANLGDQELLEKKKA